MDLFDPSQLDSKGNPTQIHDFNPGIPTTGPSAGLFWTTHIPIESVEIDLGQGTATMHIQDFATLDFFNIRNAFRNALVPRPSDVQLPVPATISLTHHWSGKKAFVDVTDFENTGLTTNRRFTGKFIEDTATVVWSATVPSKHFHFQSDPPDPTKSKFTEIGRERNGAFFRPGQID